MQSRSRSEFVNYFAKTLAVLLFACAGVAGAATYYVSPTGDDTKAGTSEATAWKTITQAGTKAQAGDTVYISGGNYGAEHVVIQNSGTADKPIVFEGRNGTPVLDQGSRARDYKNRGLLIQGKSYVTVRNISFAQYMECVRVEKSSYVTLDNVVAHDCGWTRWEGTGIALLSSNHCTLKNCTITNAGGENLHLVYADDNLIEGCKVLGTLDGKDQYATDYYMVISWSSRNTIKDCYAEDKSYTGKGNHGIGIKDTQTRNPENAVHGHSTGNKFINCKAYGFEEAIFCAWGATGNTYTNCVGDSSKKDYFFANGIMVRDGAHDNLFENCTGIGSAEALCIYDKENVNQNANGVPREPQANNKFVNCTFEAKDKTGAPGQLCVFMRNAKGNIFEKCTFTNGENLIRCGKDTDEQDKNAENKFVDCTITNVKQLYDTRALPYPHTYKTDKSTVPGYEEKDNASFAKCNFWKVGFATPGGEGNFAKDPSATKAPATKTARKPRTAKKKA